MLHVREVTSGKSLLCRTVLSALPEWFGRADAIEHYVSEAAAQPMLAADLSERTVGFTSLKIHSVLHCEIYSMGVLREHHRCGVGRGLVQKALEYAGARGCRLVSVRTLGEAHRDPAYARTRAFYDALGFEPFETNYEVWGDGLPCLTLVRPVSEQWRS